MPVPGLHVLFELSLYGVGSSESVTPGHAEHAAFVELPTPGEYLPLRHGWHSNAPDASEYLPAAHSEHAASLALVARRAPKKPAWHSVPAHDVALSAWEYLPAGQPEHSPDVALRKRPAVHVWHALAWALPSPGAVLPGGQDLHARLPVASANLEEGQDLQLATLLWFTVQRRRRM